MPIDFARLAATFQPVFKSQMQPITAAFQRLGKWLGARYTRAQALEMATRDFPVIRFYNEAVTAVVDRSQHASLSSSTSPAPTLSSSGQAFVNGLAHTGTAISESLILPRLLGLAQSFLDLVLASIERFRTPTPQMFDPRQRTASDLFGELGLIYRSIATSTVQIRGFTQNWAEAKRLWQSEGTSPAPGADLSGVATLPAVPEQDLPTRLDTYARSILGGVLALTLLPRLLTTSLSAANLAIRARVLDMMESVQNRLFRMRRQIIDFIYNDLMQMIVDAYGLVTIVLEQLLDYIHFFIRFGLLFGTEMLLSIRTFLERLSLVINIVITVIQAVRDAMRAVLEFNLTPLLLAPLGIPGWVLAQYVAPPFTIADLFNVAVDVGIVSTRAMFENWLNTVEGAIPLASLLLRRQFNAVREILRAALRPLERLPRPPQAPSLAGVRFPNLYEAFFGSGAANFRRALESARDRLQADIPAIVNSAADFLRGVSQLFGRAAAGAANLGSLERYQAIAERASRLADTVYGDQSDAIRRQMASRELDPLAQAFERWIVHGGFSLLGAAIPQYVRTMFGYWQAQVVPEGTAPLASVETVPPPPTSPHILARRARLGHVQMQRLTMRAPARALDESLAADIARRFREAIAQAYAEGQLGLEGNTV